MKSNSKLTLSKDQLQKISQLEEDSFLDYCHRVGLNPAVKKQIDFVLQKEQIKVTIKKFNEALKDSESTKMLFKESEELLNAKKDDIIRDICNYAHTLPINYQYLNSLCNKLNISSPKPGDLCSLNDFLDSIPVVNLSDFEFNAFVEEKTLVDLTIPCVCVYNRLFMASQIFIEVFTSFTFSTIPGRAYLVKQSECYKLGFEPYLQEILKRSFDLIIGIPVPVDYVVSNMLNSTNPSMYFHCIAMRRGAYNFVYYHEYGHLLMGHLPMESCHMVEFAADRFAWLVLFRNNSTPILGFWSLFGALMMLLLIDLLEKKFGLSESEKYPTVKNRIQLLLEVVAEHDRNIIQKHLDAVIAICNPTLARYWNISLEV